MQKWEYRVLQVMDGGVWDAYCREFQKCPHIGFGCAHVAQWYLPQLGDDGWEVVGFARDDDSLWYTLRRPKP